MFLLPNITMWLLPSPGTHSLLDPVVLFLTFSSTHPGPGLSYDNYLYPVTICSAWGQWDATSWQTAFTGLRAALQRTAHLPGEVWGLEASFRGLREQGGVSGQGEELDQERHSAGTSGLASKHKGLHGHCRLVWGSIREVMHCWAPSKYNLFRSVGD